jgi:CheY-like chemotaxis protein
MPEVDGLQATREIRKRLGRGVPIVAMTANAFGEDRTACLDAGMNDHIGKPVNPEALFATLLRWLPLPRLAQTPVESVSAGPARPLAERLSGIHGFDAALGLRNMKGDVSRFERMLQRFAATYSAGVPDLALTDSALERSQAAIAGHSLRGACATVGATALAHELQAFETALAAPLDAAALQAQGRRVQEELSALVSGLTVALARLD